LQTIPAQGKGRSAAPLPLTPPPACAGEERFAVAIYHCQLQNISRAEGRSAIAAVAYRSTSIVTDRTTGETFDYTRKAKALATGIELPEGAPPKYQFLSEARLREELWNSVEERENRKNSILAYEINVAIPCEITSQRAREQLIRAFAQTITAQGLAVDWAIHAPSKGKSEDDETKPDERNFHAHLMFTTRTFEAGDWSKNKLHWSNRPDKKGGKSEAQERVEKYRKDWQDCANAALKELHRQQQYDVSDRRKVYHDQTGLWPKETEHAPELVQIDCRSLEAQRADLLDRSKHNEQQGRKELAEKQAAQAEALNREPQRHMGVRATAMARKGKKPERTRWRIDDVIARATAALAAIRAQIAKLDSKQQQRPETEQQLLSKEAAEPKPETRADIEASLKADERRALGQAALSREEAAIKKEREAAGVEYSRLHNSKPAPAEKIGPRPSVLQRVLKKFTASDGETFASWDKYAERQNALNAVTQKWQQDTKANAAKIKSLDSQANTLAEAGRAFRNAQTPAAKDAALAPLYKRVADLREKAKTDVAAAKRYDEIKKAAAALLAADPEFKDYRQRQAALKTIVAAEAERKPEVQAITPPRQEQRRRGRGR